MLILLVSFALGFEITFILFGGRIFITNLENWQIALISAIGGGIPSLFVYPVREYLEEKKFKNYLVIALKSELSYCLDVLKEIQKCKVNDSGEYFVTDEKIRSEIPFDTPFYDDIETESLAKTFSQDNLMILQKIYRKINLTGRRVMRVMGGMCISKEKIDELSKEIKDVLDEI
jgi:hypothetical protein